MKTYLIKLNSEDKRKQGYNWILLSYDNKECSGEAEYIDAKNIYIFTPTLTFQRGSQHFMKTTGKLTGSIISAVYDIV